MRATTGDVAAGRYKRCRGQQWRGRPGPFPRPNDPPCAASPSSPPPAVSAHLLRTAGTVRLPLPPGFPSFSLRHDAAHGIHSLPRRGLLCGRCYSVRHPPHCSHGGSLRHSVGHTADGCRRVRRNGQPRCRTGVNDARRQARLHRRRLGRRHERVHQTRCAMHDGGAQDWGCAQAALLRELHEHLRFCVRFVTCVDGPPRARAETVEHLLGEVWLEIEGAHTRIPTPRPRWDADHVKKCSKNGVTAVGERVLLLAPTRSLALHRQTERRARRTAPEHCYDKQGMTVKTKNATSTHAVVLPLHSGVLSRPLPPCSHQYMAVKKAPSQQPSLHIAQAAPIPPTPAAAVHSCRTHRAVALGRHTCAAPHALFVELSLPPKPPRRTYRSGDAAGRASLAGASHPPQVNVAKSPRRIALQEIYPRYRGKWHENRGISDPP